MLNPCLGGPGRSISGFRMTRRRVVIHDNGILDRVVRLPIDLVGVEEIPGSVGSTRTPGGESQNGSDRLNSRFKWAGRPCWAAARVGGPRHGSAGVVAGI